MRPQSFSLVFIRVSDFLRSGWSFFFRFPNTHTENFIPSGVYLGALYQPLVFLLVSFSLQQLGLYLEIIQLQLFAAFGGVLGLSLITGFFHEDGLADTADGLGVPVYDGSKQRLERIESAMKDSRLGTYGVCALVLLWLFRFYFLLVSENSQLETSIDSPSDEDFLFRVAFLLLVSRTFGLMHASFLLPLPAHQQGGPSLTQHTSIAGHSLSTLSLGVRLGGALVLLGVTVVLAMWLQLFLRDYLIITFCYCSSYVYMVSMRRRNRKICGDLIGSSICLIELLLLLLFL